MFSEDYSKRTRNSKVNRIRKKLAMIRDKGIRSEGYSST